MEHCIRRAGADGAGRPPVGAAALAEPAGRRRASQSVRCALGRVLIAIRHGTLVVSCILRGPRKRANNSTTHPKQDWPPHRGDKPRRQYPADVRRSFPGRVISDSACASPWPNFSTLLHVRQQHARTRPRRPPAALKRVRSVIDALLPPIVGPPWGHRRSLSRHEQHEADLTPLSWR